MGGRHGEHVPEAAETFKRLNGGWARAGSGHPNRAPSVAPESEPSVSGGFWLPFASRAGRRAAYANSFAVPLVFDDAAQSQTTQPSGIYGQSGGFGAPAGGLTVGGRPF